MYKWPGPGDACCTTSVVLRRPSCWIVLRTALASSSRVWPVWVELQVKSITKLWWVDVWIAVRTTRYCWSLGHHLHLEKSNVCSKVASVSTFEMPYVEEIRSERLQRFATAKNWQGNRKNGKNGSKLGIWMGTTTGHKFWGTMWAMPSRARSDLRTFPEFSG